MLKIPELWVYCQESLKIYLLQGEHYQESEESRLFPDLNLPKILPYYIELAWTQGSSVALRQFEALDNFDESIPGDLD